MEAVKSYLYRIYSTVAVGLKSSKSFWEQPALFSGLLSVALSDKDGMRFEKDIAKDSGGGGGGGGGGGAMRKHFYYALGTPWVAP